MSWNPVLDFYIKVKNEYASVFGDVIYEYITGYTNETKTCIERWIEELHNHQTENTMYNTWLDIIEPLELNQYGDYLLFRYGRYSNVYSGEVEASGEDFWDKYDGFYRECRSVVLDVRNNCIALSPFSKFFNVNELEETSIDKVQERINRAECVEFSDKLDGSMQSARWYNNQILMAGSQAIDPNNSWRLEDGYRKINALPGYKEMLQKYPECTFIFEYISLKDSHVVKYAKEQEGLYLIGIRRSNDGEDWNYKDVITMADAFNIPSTRVFDKTLEQVMAELDDKSSDEAEGFVIYVDGWRCKVKYNDYVHIHKALSKLSSINLIIRSIADDQYDDLLSKLPVAYHDSVKKVAKIVFDYIRNTEDEIKKLYDAAPKEDKREFMIYVTNNIPREYQGYCRELYFGNKINVIKSGNEKCPHYKRLKDMGVDNYSSVFTEE